MFAQFLPKSSPPRWFPGNLSILGRRKKHRPAGSGCSGPLRLLCSRPFVRDQRHRVWGSYGKHRPLILPPKSTEFKCFFLRLCGVTYQRCVVHTPLFLSKAFEESCDNALHKFKKKSGSDYRSVHWQVEEQVEQSDLFLNGEFRRGFQVEEKKIEQLG